MSVVEKEKAPGGNPTPQSAPAKVQIATGEGIRLPAKHKRILAKVAKNVSHTLDCLDEINNNITRNERWEYMANANALRWLSGNFRRLHRAVVALETHARREVAK